MDIKNVGEFAGYCQQHEGDAGLPEVVELADRWTEFSDRLERQYGGHGEDMDEWINEAYKRMSADGLNINHDQLIQTHEILTRFWKHGAAFDKWFQSKVIIVQPLQPTEVL